ncbi:hypothetical protein D3C74_379720 [compost metagenome]
MQIHQIRVREITIVMRLLFATHRQSFALSFIPAACLLNNFSAVIKNFGLTILFIFQTALYTTEGVHIFELRPSAQFLLTMWTQADVGITTK